MADTEGVIKYQLSYIDKPINIAVDIINELNAWRSILVALDLMGQNPNRYDGLGFGNMSHRISNTNQFIITGSQTGYHRQLQQQHYCLVKRYDLDHNTITAQGCCKPSSEALTHATIYQSQPSCRWVIHIHNPEIWRHSQSLDLPETAVDIPYGTPEMAQAVIALFRSGIVENTKLFTMAGHEDGVVAFATTLEQAGLALIDCLAKALVMDQIT